MIEKLVFFYIKNIQHSSPNVWSLDQCWRKTLKGKNERVVEVVLKYETRWDERILEQI